LGKLNAREVKFAHEYQVDLNATQAAIRAGVPARSASNQSSRMMRKAQVQNLIAKLKKDALERITDKADWLLDRLFEICNVELRDIYNPNGQLRALNEWPADVSRMVCGIKSRTVEDGEIVTEVRLEMKKSYYEMFGRHVDVAALRDPREEGGHGLPVLVLRDMTGGFDYDRATGARRKAER